MVVNVSIGETVGRKKGERVRCERSCLDVSIGKGLQFYGRCDSQIDRTKVQSGYADSLSNIYLQARKNHLSVNHVKIQMNKTNGLCYFDGSFLFLILL